MISLGVTALVFTGCGSRFPKDHEPRVVDLAGYTVKVYEDAPGHFLAHAYQAAPPAPAEGIQEFSRIAPSDLWFYGDGSTLFALDFHAYGSSGAGRELFFHSTVKRSAIVVAGGTTSVRCDDQTRDVRPLPEPDAQAVLRNARVIDDRMTFKPYLLLRDAEGVFTYVDRIPPDYGDMPTTEPVWTEQYHLFRGKPGAMELIPIAEVDGQAYGRAFTTARGKLEVPEGTIVRMGDAATWTEGSETTPSELLAVGEHMHLIQVELGVYEGVNFTTPCTRSP